MKAGYFRSPSWRKPVPLDLKSGGTGHDPNRVRNPVRVEIRAGRGIISKKMLNLRDYLFIFCPHVKIGNVDRIDLLNVKQFAAGNLLDYRLAGIKQYFAQEIYLVKILYFENG